VGRRALTKRFFEERTDQSEVKARIVQKYFETWAKVIMPAASRYENKIAYIDLYAGPGRYKDGAASTPLLVLERAIADPKISKMLVALFNDRDANSSSTLQQEIDSLPGIEKLTHRPQVLNNEVDVDAEQYFSSTKLIPSFSFIDPFGYKGLSLRIIHGVIKDWGSDCVFFFNYNRINAGLSNDAVEEHLDALFGQDRANELRRTVEGKTPNQREALILEKLASVVRSLGGKYVLPFQFRNASGARTSHYLVFVSKHPRGYKIMKDIMASESSTADQGVPSFAYCPADAATPLLFSLSRPLDALEGLLLTTFAGKSLTMSEVFERHNVDTPYVERNYKDALRRLEEKGLVKCNPPASSRQKRRGQVTFGNDVLVKFSKGVANGE
jgi:three-Cys-motif partner protein